MTIDDHLAAAFGDRETITRDDLRAWLAMMATNGAIDLPGIGREISADAPANWANAARGIVFISLFDEPDGPASIRYDEPGSMHPMQFAAACFVSEDLPAGSVDYLRDHCERIIIVTG